jgi:DNA invertase Pin-like site-specific DNA recombinase
VSTADQNPDLQHDALKAVGCYRIFVDTASGALDERPALAKALDQVRPRDTLVVWKLDRLGRSLRHLIDAGISANRTDQDAGKPLPRG